MKAVLVAQKQNIDAAKESKNHPTDSAARLVTSLGRLTKVKESAILLLICRLIRKSSRLSPKRQRIARQGG